MLDAAMRKLIDPPLNRLGARMARAGIGADTVTLAGLALGLLAAVVIALGAPGLALVPLLASRLADGLDGAVARATQKTDFGGYLDITADFLFYGAVPMGFVWLDPGVNGAAGAFLLASFYVNGASFLGYAILAERAGMQTTARGAKSLYFTGGLLEGTETIAFFVIL
ncbi:CDP-alcohol phosphatidyltransferase family protein, partial [Escherichia coli]|nr:CDP-alcohol phosphatidyltransferase family protein [Escherichia coli]